jgi:hypothetical protein
MGEVGAVVGSVEDHCPHALFVRRRKTTETRASPPKGYGQVGWAATRLPDWANSGQEEMGQRGEGCWAAGR